MNAFLLFEVFDFPPFWFVLDAHACWHLGTIGLPFLWYSFLTGEAQLEYKHQILKDLSRNKHSQFVKICYFDLGLFSF